MVSSCFCTLLLNYVFLIKENEQLSRWSNKCFYIYEEKLFFPDEVVCIRQYAE